MQVSSLPKLSVYPYKRILILVVMAIAYLAVTTSPIEAQNRRARISNIRCSITSTELVYTFRLEVDNMRNRETRVGVWLNYVSNDRGLLHTGSSNFRYRDPSGYVTSQDVVRPRYNDSLWESFTLRIPRSVLPIATGSGYSFYPYFEVQDGANNNRSIGSARSQSGDCVVIVTPLATPRLRPNDTPLFGSISLSGFFLPDPRSVRITGGGSISAREALGGSCKGYITGAPSYRVRYRGGASFLRFYFESSSDTTMVVRAPDGRYYCDDDSHTGSNPRVAFSFPSSGTYEIWIGSYSSGGSPRGRLYVSERRR